MARLNEPAAPIETMESLKRKFMRQNRDIARANSTQSLRIRNLENETSRLLAANLDLREQLIRLQNELENGKTQRTENNTAAVKSQLEAKLLELGALITSLGIEPNPKKSPRVGKITRASPSRSPDPRNWKNICTLSEAVAGQDVRLPPILENKSYPRQTLEYTPYLAEALAHLLTIGRTEELLSIVSEIAADSADSPEIGPPPVSQFVEDPVKINLPTRACTGENGEPYSLDPALSINLEQRKKRKDSVGGSESRRVSKPGLSSGIQDNNGSLKTGAKRKFSVRDNDEQDIIALLVDDSLGDIKLKRGVSEERSKHVTQSDNTTTKPLRDMAIPKGVVSRDKASLTSVRKVLAPKSVNVSPRKSKGAIIDDAKEAKGDVPKVKVLEKKHDAISIMPSAEPMMNVIDFPIQPETPAGFNMLSPISSQSSISRAESRDTPPPPELGIGAEGQRPSRRARGAVSYAEPNLRDKMRRPTKELADAVGAETKRNSVIKIDDDDVSTGIQIKLEPEAEDAWKSMPAASSLTAENSPMSGKDVIATSLPSSITTHRKRRESILHGTEPDPLRSGSGSAMAALLASSRKVKAGVLDKTRGDAQPMAEGTVDIYEFRGSSPTEPEDVARKSVSRLSRRYSAIGKDTIPTEESQASNMEVPRGLVDGLSSRRRQSTLGVRSGSSVSNVLAKCDDSDKTALKKSIIPTATVDHVGSGSRSDRIAARRRSMVL